MRAMLVAAAALAVVALCGWWVLDTHPAGVPSQTARDGTRPRPQGDQYVFAVGAEPRQLNPFTAVDSLPFAVLSYTHDALMETDPHSGEVVETLAESVEAKGDGRSFVVTLRDGVRFSDGDPLTMADVMFTWELGRSEVELPGVMWTGLRLLETVEKLDDRHLKMVLKERHFAGLGAAAKAYVVTQKKYFVAQVRAAAERAGVPVPAGPGDPAFAGLLLNIELPGPGTGPYELGRAADSGELLWHRGIDLLLTPNPYSWRLSVYPELWNLAGIKLLFESDDAARIPLLRQQKIDWVYDYDARERLRADPALAKNYRAWEYGMRDLGPAFVVWNHDHPALADSRVRTALTMLFDRDGLVALRGFRACRASSWFAPDSPRAGDFAPVPHSIERAGALLAEAGWGPSHPLDLTVITMGVPDWEQIIDFAKPAFAQAGVTLRKKVLPYQLIEASLADRSFEGLLYAWNPDVFNDPTEIFHSTKGDNNWMHYASEEMDSVLEQARVEMDPQRRLALYHRFNEIFQRDQPVTLLFHRRVSSLLHKRFRGVEVGALGLSPRRWWVEPEEQRYR